MSEQLDKVVDLVIERAAVNLLIGWCRGALAKDARGERTNPLGDDACSFCISGSLWRAAVQYYGAIGTDSRMAYETATERVESVIGYSIPRWNDHFCQSANEAILLLQRARLQ